MATWTAPRTWVAGETVTAALLNTHLRDNLLALGQAWTSYTPTLTAATVNPTIGATGNVLIGAYRQAGKDVIARFKIKFGTTGPAAGTGQYFVALPVAANVTTPVAGGNCYLFDSSASGGATPVPYLVDTNRLGFLYPATWPSGALTFVGAATPWTWAGADELNATFAYEAA